MKSVAPGNRNQEVGVRPEGFSKPFGSFEPGYATNPINLCVPSQYGLFFDCPQRQSAHFTPAAAPPSAPTIRTLPSSSSGPLSASLMRSVVDASASLSFGSPRTPGSEKPASRWLLSHRGLFFDAPQRHAAGLHEPALLVKLNGTVIGANAYRQRLQPKGRVRPGQQCL